MSNSQVNRMSHNTIGNQEITEDGPVLQSVAMVSRQPTTISSSQYPHGMMPFTAKSSFDVSPLSHTLSSKLNVKEPGCEDANTIFFPTTWRVTNVKAVPLGHTLERTHVCIPESTIDTVTKNITDIIRKLSIAAVYDDDEAQVSCETKCGVRFTLRLWLSKDHIVVAECQRSAGCGFTFCQTAKKVLKAAKNGSSATAGVRNSKTPSVPKCIRDTFASSLKIPSEDMSSTLSDSLNLVQDMFCTDKLDVKLLAMESLSQLAQTCDDEYRVAVARSLTTNSDLFGKVLSLVMYANLEFEMNDTEVLSTIEQEHYNMMHRRSLCVLSSCLAALSEHGELTTVVERIENLDTLLKKLVQVVSNASTNPHEASDACICLKLLSSRSNYIKRRVDDLCAPMHAERAKKLHRHVILEQAAEMLLGELRP